MQKGYRDPFELGTRLAIVYNEIDVTTERLNGSLVAEADTQSPHEPGRHSNEVV
jgi:hypothetical protein